MNIQDNSIFTIGLVQIFLLILSAISWERGNIYLSAILFFPALLGFISKCWTRFLSKRFTVHISCEKTHFFLGGTTDIAFHVENNSILSASWFDVKDNNSCTHLGKIPLKGNAVFNRTFLPASRGVFRTDTLHFYTGDPFALCQCEIVRDDSSCPEIVVYPKIVPVITDMFTKNIWEGQCSKKGVLEDLSVIKGSREYIVSDSPKHINWRLASRGQGLNVNVYEKIRPSNIHFIFDGESFAYIRKIQSSDTGTNPVYKKEVYSHELENSLSILSSIIIELNQQGIYCGFSFPKDDNLGACNIISSGASVPAVLYRMAEYYPESLPVSFGGSKDTLCISPFNMTDYSDIREHSDKIYFISFDENHASQSPYFDSLSMTLLTYDMISKMKEEKNG